MSPAASVQSPCEAPQGVPLAPLALQARERQRPVFAREFASPPDREIEIARVGRACALDHCHNARLKVFS